MTDKDYSSAELHGLMDELCNGTLEGERHLRFQSILKASKSARAEYIELIDLHFDLKRLHAQTGDLSDPIISELSKDLLHLDSQRLHHSFAWKTWKSWATLAATLVIGAAITWSIVARRNTVNPDTSVILSQTSGARFFGETVPLPGSSVRFGHEYALSSGMVELKFPTGASAIVESPAIFEVSSATKLLLSTGGCSVYAPDGAQGFRVDTPLANVVDLGTRFVINVNQSGETAVEVVEGEAEVYPKHNSSELSDVRSGPINLREHQASYLGVTSMTVEDDGTIGELYKRGLPDRIVSFDAVTDKNAAVDDLIAVTVQRGGHNRRYFVDDMIGIDVVHYHGSTNAFMVIPANVDAMAIGASRSQFLDRDRSLCSGLINPAGSKEPLLQDPVLSSLDDPNLIGTPGLGIRFQSPVVNGPGPDVVVFELQTIVNPESGDPFHVSPLHFAEGLHSYTVKKYDIDLVSSQSKFISPFRLCRSQAGSKSLAEALNVEIVDSQVHIVRAKVLTVGIDLSDLGYQPGDLVDGLFFQDAVDDGNYFDFVYVAGLPPIP